MEKEPNADGNKQWKCIINEMHLHAHKQIVLPKQTSLLEPWHSQQPKCAENSKCTKKLFFLFFSRKKLCCRYYIYIFLCFFFCFCIYFVPFLFFFCFCLCFYMLLSTARLFLPELTPSLPSWPFSSISFHFSSVFLSTLQLTLHGAKCFYFYFFIFFRRKKLATNNIFFRNTF